MRGERPGVGRAERDERSAKRQRHLSKRLDVRHGGHRADARDDARREAGTVPGVRGPDRSHEQVGAQHVAGPRDDGCAKRADEDGDADRHRDGDHQRGHCDTVAPRRRSQVNGTQLAGDGASRSEPLCGAGAGADQRRGAECRSEDDEQPGRVAEHRNAVDRGRQRRGVRSRQHRDAGERAQRAAVPAPLVRGPAHRHRRRGSCGFDCRRQRAGRRDEHADRERLREGEGIVGHAVGVGGDVDRIDGARHRADGDAREKRTEQEAERRARDAEQHAFAEERAEDGGARGTERAQRPDLGPPLHDGDGERVVDEEHSDQKRDVRERRQVQLEAAQHSPDLVRAHRGADRPRARRKRAGDRRGNAVERAWRDLAIDAIEQSDTVEKLLRRHDVDEDHARIDLRDVRGQGGHDAQRDGAVAPHRVEQAPGAQVIRFRHAVADDRTASGNRDEWIDRGRRSSVRGRGGRALALRARQRLQEIHSEHAQDLAGERLVRPPAHDDRILDHRRSALHAGDAADAQQRALVEAATHAEHLQVDAVGDQVDAGSERRDRGRVGQIDGEADCHAKGNGRQGDARA